MVMRLKPRLLSGLLAQVIGIGLMTHGSGAAAIGLLKAYEAALQNDATYRAAYYAKEGGKENRILGRSNLLPSLSANYSNARSNSEITTAGRTRDEEYLSKSASVQLRQPVINMEGYARYKQGNLQADYSDTLFLSEQQQVALRVVGAYVEVLFKQDQLSLAKAERDMYEERMKANDRLFEKGEGTRTDMLETRARLDVGEAAVLEAEDNLRATRVTLADIVGGEIGELDNLAQGFAQRPPENLGFEAWRRVAVERNPELKARALSVEIGQQEINKAKAGHYPRLDITASYSKSTSDSINTIDQEYKTRAIGFQVSIPLYSGGAVSASTRQAVANREKARAELQAETDKALLELRKNYDQLASSVSRITALEKAAESGKLLVTATEQSIKGGVRINLDLLDAQRQLSTTQRDLAQARYTYVLAYLKLRAAAGTLSGDDVREMSAYFH